MIGLRAQDDEIQDWRVLEELDTQVLEIRTVERLRQLLGHAYQHVPYYRDAMDECGVRPSQIQGLSDLAMLPSLSKEQVREGVKKRTLLASNIPSSRRVPTQTTGSTGIPLFFFGDALSRRVRSRGWKLLNRWAGIQPGDDRAWLTVLRPKPAWDFRHPLSSWHERRWFRQPEDLIPVGRLKVQDLPRIVSAIDRSSPYFVYGIASVIRFIAEHGPEARCSFAQPPRAVVGTSDTFVLEHRRQAQGFFRSPAFSRYGAYEFGGGVAQTCPDNPRVHHVLSELVVMEVVDETGQAAAPGKSGRLLVTDLTNSVMPFIRYDIGDIAVAEASCGCGRPWPVIGEVFGRPADRLRTVDGDWIHAWELEAMLFYQRDLKTIIAEYQFIQRRSDELEMLLVPKGRLKATVIGKLRVLLEEILGSGMKVTVSPVPYIAPEPNGKRRLAICEIRQGG